MADGDPLLEPLSTAGIAPNTADYLVGTADAGLTAEIVVGASPGGELGGTWTSPTVDATHSGSAHHNSLTIGADGEHSLATQVLSGVDASTAQKGHASFNSADFSVSSGAVSLVAGAGGLLLTAYKDTDQEVTGTTLTADTELAVTLATNGKYQFRLALFFLNDGATEGVKVSLNGTAVVTDVKAQVSIYDDTLNSLVAFGRITSLGGAGIGAGLSSGSNYATIEGAIEITTAGTLLLEFAQNAAGASAGVHCEVGSSMTVTKLE